MSMQVISTIPGLRRIAKCVKWLQEQVSISLSTLEEHPSLDQSPVGRLSSLLNYAYQIAIVSNLLCS